MHDLCGGVKRWVGGWRERQGLKEWQSEEFGEFLNLLFVLEEG
jgi:hypothetical protein